MARPKTPLPGVSLRAAAEELGMTRHKLLKHVRDGLPVTRVSERVYVNVRDARLWLALNDLGEDAPRPLAPTLDPADPRFRERTAAARLGLLKAGLRAGALVKKRDTLTRYSEELGEFRQTYLAIPQRLIATATRDVTMADLEHGIEEALAPLKADDIGTWPVNGAAIAGLINDNCGDASNGDSDGDRPRLAVLPSADPRHAFALTQSSKREIQLSEFESSVYPLAHVLQIAARSYDAIRSRVRKVPTFVDLAEDGDLIRTIGFELDAALEDLSADLGTESSHAQG